MTDETQLLNNLVEKLNRQVEELNQYKVAIEQVYNHVVITDINGNIQYANKAAEQISGYSFDEMKGNTPRLWGRQMDKEFYIHLWKTIKDDRKPFKSEVKNKRKNGEYYYASVTITPLTDQKENLIGFMGVEEDISRFIDLDIFFETTQDLMCIANQKGYFEKVSPSFEVLLGYTTDEILMTPYIEFIHKDDVVATNQEIEKLSRGEKTIHFINRYRKKDGTYLFLEWNATPVDSKLYASARDVTIEKNLVSDMAIKQERLQEITNRFSFATSAAKIGVWEWDVIPNILIWDDQMYALYGISRKDFSGAYDAWQNGLHPDDKKFGDEEIQKALRGEKDFDTTFRVLWPDKSIHYIRAYAIVERNTKGTADRMVGVNWDITAEKKYEENLQVYKSLVRDTSDAIINESLNGIVSDMNSAAEKMYGYKAEEVVGKNISIIFPKDKKSELEYYQKEINSGRKIDNYKTQRVRKDGTIINVSVTVSPIYGQNMQISSFSVIARNIDADIRVDKMKSEFISLASHQLRTPLTATKWFLERIISGEGGILTEAQKTILEKTQRANTKTIALVSSLLNISRIESGRIIVDSVPSNIAEILREVLDEVKATYRQKNQLFQEKIYDAIPQIMTDPKLIRNVLLNLLTNACKYSPDSSEISVKLYIENEFVVFEVRDHGYGIPQKQQEKLFSKFFRGDNIVKIVTDGTGLGLYLVKQIIDTMGCNIRFESTESKGTTFWLSIPRGGTTSRAGEVNFENFK